MLIALGGLPGTGKSTLATAFAGRLRAIHLRIDTIEQAMRHAGQDVSAAEGYLVARDVALDKLGLGLSVVVDAVNPIEFTRNLWRHAASRCGARLLEIELVCSDDVEHRRRVESRTADIPGFVLPTWSDVQDLLAVLDHQLAQHHYLCSNEFTVADIATWCWVRSWKWAKIDITGRPRVVEWVKRVRARPGVERGISYGVPKEEIDQFSEERKARYGKGGGSIASNSALKTDL